MVTPEDVPVVKHTKLKSISSGIAGEYLVAAELTRQGYVASLTLKNTQGVDILAASADGTKQVAIQVKCDQGSSAEWVLNAKAERLESPTLFYVFVRLNNSGQHGFHVVPSSTVAKYTRETHQAWLRTPGKKGQPHRDNRIRKFADRQGTYKDAWPNLGLGPTAA